MMCVEQSLDEMLCFEIWIQKEEDRVKMCPIPDDLFPLPPLDCFLSLFFKGKNIKLAPYICNSSSSVVLEGRLLPFRVADISHLSDLSSIDATAWIKSLF